MKKYVVCFLMAILLTGCQKEEFSIEEEQEEASFLQDVELTALIKGVASHDGSFDDSIDGASCFSIKFPYQILINNEIHSLNSSVDLSIIEDLDVVEPIFPITISMATYIEMGVMNSIDFNKLRLDCANGVLFNDRITCVDIQYPISVGVFAPETENFETIIFDHDKKTFQSIEGFLDDTRASIRYPIVLYDQEGNSISIETNQDLKNNIAAFSEICE